MRQMGECMNISLNLSSKGDQMLDGLEPVQTDGRCRLNIGGNGLVYEALHI